MDRYACFAEIQSQSSSIFDSYVDQLANSDTFSNTSALNDSFNATSKSLNNSFNGGFGAHHQDTQLSQSFNGTNTSFKIMSSPTGKNDNFLLHLIS